MSNQQINQTIKEKILRKQHVARFKVYNPYEALYIANTISGFHRMKYKIKRLNPIMRLYYWIQFKFSYSGIVSTQSEAGKTAESFNPKNSSR